MEIASKEEVQALAMDVKDIKDMLKQYLMLNKQCITLSVKDIAKIEGLSPSYLYGKGAFYLPRYGVSAYPDKGITRWDYDEYLEWRQIPAETRERTFKEIHKRR